MQYLSQTIYALVIIAILAIAALFLVSLVPIPGNVEVKIVQSGSMEPSIMTGAIVVIKPESSYSVGEVVTFGKDTKKDVPTTHRIVLAKTDAASGGMVFTTKGDNNEDVDPNPLYEKDIIGKVIFDMPYVGYILDFAKKPIGFSLLIAIPAGLIILDEARVILREVLTLQRRRKRENHLA